MLATGCTLAPTYRVNHDLLTGQRTLPERVLLLPPRMTVCELNASGAMEVLPDRTEAANAGVLEALGSFEPPAASFERVSLAALSAEQAAILDQHLALFDVVAVSAFSFPSTEDGVVHGGWEHKLEHFDLTLGPGLAWLADASGAEVALVAMGTSLEATGGRALSSFLESMLVGGTVSSGASGLVVGLVDLRTGDLLWADERARATSAAAPAYPFHDASKVIELLEEMFERYPGLEEYRSFFEE